MQAHLRAVVRRGTIVEEGSHRELVRIPDGAYATLVRLQQQRAAAGDEDADSLVRPPCTFRTPGALPADVLCREQGQCLAHSGRLGFRDTGMHSFHTRLLTGISTHLHCIMSSTGVRCD